MRILIIFLFALIIAVPALGVWNFDRHSIPVDEIISGGPPRDGIPALNNPDYVSVKQASFLKKDDQVIGLVINGEARAYPLRIMSWHELVNDRIGDLPILVSW
jgi:hypothetical protein